MSSTPIVTRCMQDGKIRASKRGSQHRISSADATNAILRLAVEGRVALPMWHPILRWQCKRLFYGGFDQIEGLAVDVYSFSGCSVAAVPTWR